LEEGQQHFASVREALEWIQLAYHKDCVYRDDGLMVWWARTLERKQLNVEVWQMYIDGRKPTLLPGSQNDRISLRQPNARYLRPRIRKRVSELLSIACNKNMVAVPLEVSADSGRAQQRPSNLGSHAP
jgi:hypothetical protein